MTIETAKSKLSESKNVNDWNLNRDSIKGQLTVEQLATIDGSGFIKEVSKVNNWKQTK